jgi:hypothetical protein
MYFGTLVARKGGLTKEACLNSFDTEDILKHFKK